MKKLFYLIVLAVLVFACQPEKPGKFEINSGVNVSHWLSQSEKRGDERRNYITERDFDTIAKAGFDHVRLCLDEVQMWDSLGNKEPEAFELMHNAIYWALKYNLRVIVDLHIIRSHYFNAASNALWTDPKEQDKFVDFWKQLSAELIKYPTDKVAYELMNEAVAENPDDWNNLMAKAIGILRVNEPARVIVMGSNRWQIPSTFPDLKIPENDTNIILSFHFYTPMPLTHHMAPWNNLHGYKGTVNYPGLIIDTVNNPDLNDSLLTVIRPWNGVYNKETLYQVILPAIETAKKLNLKLFCGEYGIYPTIPEEPKLNWYKDMVNIFKENNIAYCHWCYKGDFPVVGENSVPKHPMVDILTGKQ